MSFIAVDIVTSERSLRNVATMEQSRLGIIMISIGAILFLVSLFIILLQFDYYLISLFAMFISVVMIAIGFAYTKSEVSANENSE